MGTFLADKYQEYDMNNKLLDGGAATLKGLAVAGKFLYKIAKPVVKYTSIRAVQGIGYLAKQAEFQLSDDEKDDDDDDEQEEEEKKDKSKKNKKHKKKKDKNDKKEKKEKKEKNSFNLLESNNSISSSNNNQGSSLCLKEGQYIFQPCVDYPTFESINKIENINYNQNNNNINMNQQYNNNFNNFNVNQNNNSNNMNQQNNNIFNINQQPPCINNHIIKPDYVIPPGLESSSLESSIVEEK